MSNDISPIDYLEQAKLIIPNYFEGKKAVIGISGGVDSAVVAYLCAQFLDKKDIIGITMPYGDQSTEDADLVAEQLGLINYKKINIKIMVDEFINAIGINDKLTNGNIRARTRMIILYAHAGANNGLVVGTSNRTELALGYFTKFGDGACDFEPIGDLYKTEVFDLARYLKVPQRIIDKAPSAELWDGQTDETEIGLTYKKIDNILKFHEIISYIPDDLMEYDKNIKMIYERIKNSAHKRKMPQIIKVRRNIL